MESINVDTKFRKIVERYGIADAARRLHRRYSAVRQAALDAGIKIRRGRRPDGRITRRNAAIRSMREKRMFLSQIAKKHDIGRERVRQILKETGGDPLKKRKRPARR